MGESPRYPQLCRFLYGNSFLKKVTSVFVVTSLVVSLGVISTSVKKANAASLTSVSDTMSNVTANASSTHTIIFTTPTGIANSSTTIITFTGWANLGQIGTSSIDILVGNSTTTATQQVIASSSSAGAGVWGFATSSNILTLTAPTSGTVPTAGQVVIIKIGTNATSSAQGTQNLTNPAAGTYTPTITGNMTDSGSFTVNIVTNATVSVSATVSQSLSFAILSATSTAFNNNTYFGALSSAGVKFASSTNTSGDSASTTAHVLTMSTNAPTGYTITLQGDTLRNQSATTTTIAAIGAVPSPSVAGTAQFGINVTASGGSGAVVDSTYGTTNQYGYGASTSTADTLAFGTVPTTTTTFNIQYVANIPATQAAGTYTTAITYVGTANF